MLLQQLWIAAPLGLFNAGCQIRDPPIEIRQHLAQTGAGHGLRAHVVKAANDLVNQRTVFFQPIRCADFFGQLDQ